jgi:hypothetical protein
LGSEWDICHSAVGSWHFPLYEVKEGVLYVSPDSMRYKNTEIKPQLRKYVSLQGRFRKMTPKQFEVTLEECKRNRDFMLGMNRRRIRPS